LPDVFCAAHTHLATAYDMHVLTPVEMATRLVYLAGSIPPRLWVLAHDRLSEHADVLTTDLRLDIDHATRVNGWRVVVYSPASPVAVFAAVGPSHHLVVQYCTAGPWVMALKRLMTLRGVEARR
jgi:hypothetical protein